ncbi:hypothetical protein [Halobacteriovorax sp. YZS-1-1]|uniref:hypothetical protein n=1 Tax=unclassified Halobacteriovorax TaxID=2639665 RepID=UPI00399B0C98
MKALNLSILILFSLNSLAFDGLFEDLSEMADCVECVIMEGASEGQGGGYPSGGFSGGGFPTTSGGGMGGGVFGSGMGGYGVGITNELTPKKKKEIAKQFAMNQLQYHIGNSDKDTINLDEYFNSVDPENELKRQDREEIVADLISRSTTPFYEYDSKTGVGSYTVSPNIDRLIRSSQATGYIVSDESYKDRELAQAYISYQGDVDGLVKYLKDNFSGEKLAEAANQYAMYTGVDSSGNLTDGYYKLMKLSLEEGELSNDKVMNLIRHEITTRALGGKPTPLSGLIERHIDVTESFRNNFGDNLACEYAKGVYLNTNKWKEESSAMLPNGASSYPQMNYEQEEMIKKLKESAVVNNVNMMSHYQALGGNLEVPCGDGKYPKDYLKIAMDEGLLSFMEKEELQALGVLEEDCYENVSRLDLAKLCDAASIAWILERQTSRNLRMSEKTKDSNVKHHYIEGRDNCSITVLDNIVRQNGRTVDREVQVLLNSDEVILKTKSMDQLKASIKELYDK